MRRTSVTFNKRSWTPSATPMSTGPKADSADLQPVASEESPIRLVHSHRPPSEYPQELGGKFSQGFCDATVNRPETVVNERRDFVNEQAFQFAWDTTVISNQKSRISHLQSEISNQSSRIDHLEFEILKN